MGGAVSNLAVAVPAAVGAAAGFGLTGAMQYVANRRVRRYGTLRPRLLVDLARQPIWQTSLLVNGVGIALHWLALRTGPLALVQPVLATGLLFGVLFTALMLRQRPDRTAMLGAALCATGLAVFLLVAQPTATRPANLTAGAAFSLAAVLAVILAVCMNVAAHKPERVRAIALAVAAGVLYGVTAGLVRVALESLSQGVGAMFSNWPIYGGVVCGVLGFLLNQNAFQRDTPIALPLALIISLDPLVGIGIGLLWLGETVRGQWFDVAGEVVALVVLFAGIALLSRRAPHVAVHEGRSKGTAPVRASRGTGAVQWPTEGENPC